MSYEYDTERDTTATVGVPYTAEFWAECDSSSNCSNEDVEMFVNGNLVGEESFAVTAGSLIIVDLPANTSSADTELVETENYEIGDLGSGEITFLEPGEYDLEIVTTDGFEDSWTLSVDYAYEYDVTFPTQTDVGETYSAPVDVTCTLDETCPQMGIDVFIDGFFVGEESYAVTPGGTSTQSLFGNTSSTATDLDNPSFAEYGDVGEIVFTEPGDYFVEWVSTEVGVIESGTLSVEGLDLSPQDAEVTCLGYSQDTVTVGEPVAVDYQIESFVDHDVTVTWDTLVDGSSVDTNEADFLPLELRSFTDTIVINDPGDVEVSFEVVDVEAA